MVLAVQAAEITARTGQRQAARIGMEPVNWLLLDRIVCQGTRLAIDITHHHASFIPAAPAKPMLPLPHGTSMWTQKALQPAILLFLVISTLDHFLIFL